jgi:L-aspartate oxidase
VVHAGGDATGSVVASALKQALMSGGRVELHENEFVVDLITHRRRCVGAISLGPGNELTFTFARAVILACGGAGQVYRHTTNPEVATGDGQAMAYRAGAVLRDAEFMQFHPTALYADGNPTLLLTEALRGEGAFLLDQAGERFMVGAHPRAELAPRDVVVRQMRKIMDRDKVSNVWLDARHLPCAFLKQRFPTVTSGLQARGYDLCTQLIPVAPASHYYIGGVMTDLWGRTSIPGLYSCGETASTGIHGANRLASNSLLEGLVFGDRTVRDIDRYLSVSDPSVRKVRLELPEDRRDGNDPAFVEECRSQLKDTMTESCGIVREADGLERARVMLREMETSLKPLGRTVAEVELLNLLTVARQITEAAGVRRESRGVHLRSDFPERDDKNWRRHLVLCRDPQTGGPVVDAPGKDDAP